MNPREALYRSGKQESRTGCGPAIFFSMCVYIVPEKVDRQRRFSTPPPLCSVSCTGFLCGSASCSRLRLSSTGPRPATPRVTWPTTVRLSPTLVSDNCVLSTLEHSLLLGRAAVLETGPLPPQDHTSLEQSVTDYVGCHTASFRRLLKTFQFGQ